MSQSSPDLFRTITGDLDQATRLVDFLIKLSGDKQEDSRLHLITAAIMAGRQQLSPLAAYTIASAIRDSEAGEALYQMAQSMCALKRLSAAIQTLPPSHLPDVGRGIEALGDRQKRYGELIQEKGWE